MLRRYTSDEVLVLQVSRDVVVVNNHAHPVWHGVTLSETTALAA